MGKGSGNNCSQRPSLLFSGSSGVVKVEEHPIIQQNMTKQWTTPTENDILFSRQAANILQIHDATAQRVMEKSLPGADYKEVERFLKPSLTDIRSGEDTTPGMKSAVADLLEHVKQKKKIAVFADYDVDGGTSSAIMQKALDHVDADYIIGYASARDGFGLSQSFVQYAAEQQCSMLITLDCGSDSSDAVDYAQGLGLKVIVLDHHNVDMENPAEHHLNPAFEHALEIKRGTEIKYRIQTANRLLNKAKKDGLNSDLYQQQLEHCIQEVREFCPDKYQNSSDYKHNLSLINKHLAKMADGQDHGSASELSWKMGAELLEQETGEVPEWWNKEPLYMAGMGASADMADMTVQENRAFARVASDTYGIEAAPLGVRMLAKHFEEDPSSPSSLIRTRAALNLAKRTWKVNAAQTVAVYQAKNQQEAQIAVDNIIKEYEDSTQAREEMQELANQFIEKLFLMQKKAHKKQGFKNWAYAIIDQDKYQEYVGQAGIIAPKIAKEYNLPAVVFTKQGVDAEGKEIFKWSARNNVIKKQIGEILKPKWKVDLDEACQYQLQTPEGITTVSSCGGHSDVVSGTCRKENIKHVLKVMDNFANSVKMEEKKKGVLVEKDYHDWQSYDNNSMFFGKRKVTSQELQQIEDESKLLEPFDIRNFPVRVSAVGQITSFGEKKEITDKATPAIFKTEDGIEKECLVDDNTLDLLQQEKNKKWEFSLTPRPGIYYIKQLRPLQ